MNRKLLLITGGLLVFPVLGCQSETPVDGSASQVDNQIESTNPIGPDLINRDAVHSVDPAVDAGMKADALEREQSVIKEHAIEIDRRIETNPSAEVAE